MSDNERSIQKGCDVAPDQSIAEAEHLFDAAAVLYALEGRLHSLREAEEMSEVAACNCGRVLRMVAAGLIDQASRLLDSEILRNGMPRLAVVQEGQS